MGSRWKLAGMAERVARSWLLGNLVLKVSGLVDLAFPQLDVQNTGVLREAAERAGYATYRELVYSSVPGTHSPRLDGEFIGSGYFGFSFHFAFVTGMFFPEFLQRAISHPAYFYAREVSSSVLIALGVTAFMVTGHMGVMAITAYRTNNLAEHVEEAWDRMLGGGVGSVARFCLSFLRIPFRGFPGVIRDKMSFRLDGESPLEVSASAPMFWDRLVSYGSWLISAPLITVAVLSSRGAIPHLPGAVELLTRIVVPLAFVSTIGTYLTGKGAYRAYLAEKRLGGSKKAAVGRFDLTAIKEALSKGEGHV